MRPFEPTFLEAFKENPAPIFFAFMLGAAGVVLVVVALALIVARKGSRVGLFLGLAAAACGVAAILSGVGGTFAGRRNIDAAVSGPGLNAKDRERITAHGYAEASYQWKAGVGAGLLPLLGGLGSGAFAFARRKR